MSSFKYISLISIVMLLNNCSKFRDMPNLSVSLANSFIHQRSYSKADIPVTLEQNWWKSANDQTLNDIINQITKQNLSLEQARFRLLSARQQTGKSDFLPNIDASSDIQYSHNISGTNVSSDFNTATGRKNTSYYNARIDASWEIPLYGQYKTTDDLIRANIAFAQADIDAIHASIISNAVHLYADMRRLQLEQIELEHIINAQKKVFEYDNIKYRSGLINDSDINSTKSSLFSLQNEVLSVTSQLESTKQQLAKLIGKTIPEEGWELSAAIPIFNLPPFADTPIDVLRNRPDIRKAENLVLAAAAELKLAKSEMYPNLSLSGNILEQNNIAGKALLGKSLQFSGIPTISLPLFDWGKRLANAKSKDDKLSETASSYRETVINAINEVEEFWAYYTTSLAKQVNTTKTLQISLEASKREELLFKQGIIDGNRFQNSLIKASRAKILNLQAKSDNVVHLCSLTKALGGGVTRKWQLKEKEMERP